MAAPLKRKQRRHLRPD